MVIKGLTRSLSPFLNRTWPFIAILVAICIFFYPVWLKSLVPIPGDFVVGAYFPWLDYKWGYEVGVPVKNPVTSDVVSVIYPLRSFAVDLLRTGKFPLWMPGMFTGYPLIASFDAAVLSPTMFLYFLLPKLWAWTGQIVLQPLLAAIFMYLFLRNLRLQKLPSVTGGLIYAFAGFNMIWLEWNSLALVAAWIPLIILLLDKLIETGKSRWGVMMSCAIALQVLSGYPQVVLYTLSAVLLYLYFQREKLDVYKLFKIAFFSLMGVYLSSVQLIPFIELFIHSQRTSEVLDANVRYLPWQNIVTFFAPDFFGNPATGNFWGMGLYTLNVGYTGLVAIILATIGIVKHFGNKTVRFLIVLAVGALFLSLPHPISRLLAENDKFGMAALSPTRSLVLVNFALAGLSAFGLNKLLNRKDRIDLRSLYLPLVVLGSVLLGSYLASQYVPKDSLFSSSLKVGMRNLAVPILILAAVGLASFIRYKLFASKIVRYACVAGIAFLSVIELFRFGWKYTPFSPAEYVFPETPVLTFLEKQEKPFRVSEGDVIPMNMWVPYGLESPSGYDSIYPVDWAMLLSVIKSGKKDVDPQGRYAKLESYSRSWFSLLNTKYLLVMKRNKLGKPDSAGEIPPLFKSEHLKQVFEDGSVAVLENTEAFPRAFIVSRWEIRSGSDALAALLRKDFPFKSKIILEENFRLFPQSQNNSSKVSYLNYSANSSVLEAKSDKNGFLFVSENYYPGWKVFVDGTEEKIYKANYSFRAVPLGAGTHKVEFIYDPESFKIGKWISGSTLFVLLAIFVNGQHKKTRRRAS